MSVICYHVLRHVFQDHLSYEPDGMTISLQKDTATHTQMASAAIETVAAAYPTGKYDVRHTYALF